VKRVALVGAHTAFAEQVVASAEEQGLAVEWVRATTTEYVTEDLVLAGPELLSEVDALVLCFDDPVTRALWAAPSGPPAIALAHPGLAGSDGAWVESPDALQARRVVVVPGPAEPAAAIVETLGDLEPFAARLVGLESAASFDKPGMDALSEQTRAVFGLRDVAPAFFPGPMAFGLWASSAPEGEAPDEREGRTRAILQAAMPELRWSITQLWTPSFSGELLVLEIETQRAPEGDLWARLEAGRGLRRGFGARLSSQDAVDRDQVLLGRLEATSAGLRVVGAYDRLRRGGPTQVVRWLARRFPPSAASSD